MSNAILIFIGWYFGVGTVCFIKLQQKEPGEIFTNLAASTVWFIAFFLFE